LRVKFLAQGNNKKPLMGLKLMTNSLFMPPIKMWGHIDLHTSVSPYVCLYVCTKFLCELLLLHQ